jgi:HAD superfamily hydrolase (TIGR01662 family)
MSEKVLFLDKDNTIIKTISGNFTPEFPEDQVLIPGVLGAIKNYRDEGFNIVIASNQKGCTTINQETGKTYKTEASVFEEMRYCLDLISKDRAENVIDRCLWCPDDGKTAFFIDTVGTINFLRSTHTIYRKPNAGMLEYIIENSFFDFKNRDLHFMVGDMESDRECASKAEIAFSFVDTWLKPYGQ